MINRKNLIAGSSDVFCFTDIVTSIAKPLASYQAMVKISNTLTSNMKVNNLLV